MTQVDKSAAEAEVTGRQPDVDAIRQEIEPVAEALRQGSKRNKGRKDAAHGLDPEAERGTLRPAERSAHCISASVARGLLKSAGIAQRSAHCPSASVAQELLTSAGVARKAPAADALDPEAERATLGPAHNLTLGRGGASCGFSHVSGIWHPRTSEAQGAAQWGRDAVGASTITGSRGEEEDRTNNLGLAAGHP